MSSSDVLVVGAGIAGASLAYFLAQQAPDLRVTVLEAEGQPGYHSTGRSAAAFIESYGPAQVRALSHASLPFFLQPPPGFSEHPLVGPRGLLTLVGPQHTALAKQRLAEARQGGFRLEAWTLEQALARVPLIRAERFVQALWEPDALDMDVHAIHQGYLRGLRQGGGQLVVNARVVRAQQEDGRWRVDTAQGHRLVAPVLVNAAGAWGDELADLAGVAPLRLQPKRRSALVFAPPVGTTFADWPLLMSLDENWYLKPDAGQLLGSPANAEPTVPQDVQPELEDIATAIERLQDNLNLSITRPSRTWAGLRTFSPDGELVGGFDAQAPGFFWLVGQGGYGIQTSPAMGRLCAALVRGVEPDPDLLALGLNPARLSPQRLETRPTP